MKATRAVFVAFAIFSLIVPARSFAMFQGPANFQGKYEPSQDAIQLRWENVGEYNQQTLKVTNPSGQPRTLEPRSDVSSGPKSFLDTNSGEPFVTGAPYRYQLQTTKSGETQTSDLDVYVMSEDSSIVVVKTEKGGPVVKEEYNLSCRGVSDASVRTSWNGNVTAPHDLTLYWSDSESGVLGGARTKLAESPALTTGSGSYLHENLTKEKEYWYALTWKAKTPSVPATSTLAVNCETLATSPDAPSKLYAWALSPSSLFVNWKDNAVKPHTFELQRMRLTPEKPAFPYGTTPGAVTVSDAAIKLAWRNFTNADENGAKNNLKGPYYHAFERSTSTSPFADRKEDGTCKYIDTERCDPSFTKVPFAFAEDIDWNKTKTSYEKINTGLREGTDYYYRVRGCSFVRADYTREAPGVAQNDISADACGKYGDTSYVGTSTLPAAPQGLEFTSVMKDSVSIRWKDYSRRENGFAVAVSPAPGGSGNCASGACIAPTNTSASNQQGYSLTAPFVITGLEPGTQYNVSVRSFRDGPWGRTHSLDSQKISDSRTTDVEVRVAAPAGGTIGGDCTGGQICYFDYGTPITLTAAPATGYAFTRWTEGPCTNSTEAACAWNAAANTGVAALFTQSVVLNETVRVKAYLNGVTATTSFNFSLTDPNNRTVVSGTTNVPFSKIDNYAIGSDKKFSFTYVSGGPAGATFQKIEWDNSTGSTGRPSDGLKTTGTGFIGAEGGWLEYRVYFTQATGTLPPDGAEKLLASVRDVVEGAAGYVAGFAERVAGFFVDEWAQFKAWFEETASAAIVYETVDGVTLTKNNLEVYFKQFAREGAELAQSVYEDKNLEADTAYLYRVRACYTATNCTPYDATEEGAGRTLPANAARDGNAKANVCVKNSLCGQRDRYAVPVPNGRASETQCVVNDQCRNVGTSRQFFEETER